MFKLKKLLANLTGDPVYFLYRMFGGEKRDRRDHYLEQMRFRGPVSGINPKEHLEPDHDKGICDFCQAKANDRVLAQRFNKYATQQ